MKEDEIRIEKGRKRKKGRKHDDGKKERKGGGSKNGKIEEGITNIMEEDIERIRRNKERGEQ